MNSHIRGSIPSLLFTLLILFVLEIVSTALLPLFGLVKYHIPFNILIILYLGFKLENPYISLFILVIQYFHGFFSIEGWELGTMSGILICIVVSYLKDLLHFTSAAVTIIVTQLFQCLWFIIVSSLIYMKTDNLTYIIEKFYRFIPESIVLSLLSPFFFVILDKIWKSDSSSMLGDEG